MSDPAGTSPRESPSSRWHWAVLAVLFGVSGISWLIDPLVSDIRNYLSAALVLAMAANAAWRAWTGKKHIQ